MKTIKRTFTLSSDVSAQLDAVIPNKGRSKYVSSILGDALRMRKKDEFLHLLENMPQKVNPNGLKSEDILREIRSDRARKLTDNS
ncbi:MAG: hypothetical protein ACNYPF_02360 [Candidatus Puniceispirillales bacterium WSBS_2018_MAG_OTU23]